ncbi:MAG TPA: glycosyltransferase [Syntrophales bacterium]|nr:glycosyltransferase [Syntrophales bacterium]
MRSGDKYLLFGDGESPHLLKWARELTRHFQVHLVSSRGVCGDLRRLIPGERVDALGLRVREEGGNFRILLSLPRLRSILKRVNPRFVNAHYLTSHGLLAAILKKGSFRRPFTLIQSTWGTDVLVTPFRNGAYRLAAKFALGQADLVTSDSEFMSRTIGRLTGRPVVTFPFGPEAIPPLDPKGKIPGLFYSNRALSENSNIEEILRFFGRIARERAEAALVVANDGSRRKALEEMVRAAGLESRVRFVGYLSQEAQERMYGEARFYLSLPVSDATSVSLLEAMAHGCIPIVSDIPANREWVRHGENGLLYREGLPLAEIEAMDRNWEAAAGENRRIVSERALFPERMRSVLVPRLLGRDAPRRETRP